VKNGAEQYQCFSFSFGHNKSNQQKVIAIKKFITNAIHHNRLTVVAFIIVHSTSNTQQSAKIAKTNI